MDSCFKKQSISSKNLVLSFGLYIWHLLLARTDVEAEY